MNTNFKFRNKEIFYQLLLILIIVFLYSFSLHYPIYDGWDDATYILNNSHLSLSFSNIYLYFSKPYFYMYTPLTMLSYMLDYNFWGLNSFGYHLQNIFWHIVAVITIYKCFRLFEIKSWIAFFICLIFAIHPQRVEPVVWLSERKEVLCAAFYFLSILFFLKSETQYKKRNYKLSLLFYLFALLSKPMAVSLPFILLFYMFFKNRTFKITQYLNKLWPYFIILIVFLPLTFYSQAVDNERFILSRQLYVVVYNIKFYFDTTILPISLNPIYPRISILNSIINTSVFYIATVFLLIFLLVRNTKNFFYSTLPVLLCFLISLFPIVGIVPYASFEHTDRYSYIPSVFIWFSIGLILTRILYQKVPDNNLYFTANRYLHKKFIFIVLTIYTSILLFSNYQYQKNWKDRYTLFSYSANCMPTSKLALVYLADIELKKGDYKEVLNIAKKLDAITKNSLLGYYFKASVEYHYNKESALALLLHIKPFFKQKNNDYYGRNNRNKKVLKMIVGCYSSAGNKKQAVKYINELLQIHSLNKFDQFYYQGVKSYCQNDFYTAIYWLKKALELQPENMKVQSNIKACLKLENEKTLIDNYDH